MSGKLTTSVGPATREKTLADSGPVKRKTLVTGGMSSKEHTPARKNIVLETILADPSEQSELRESVLPAPKAIEPPTKGGKPAKAPGFIANSGTPLARTLNNLLERTKASDPGLLDLYGNDLTAQQVRTVCNAIRDDPMYSERITRLRINPYLFGDEGATAVADLLRVNTTLQELYMRPKTNANDIYLTQPNHISNPGATVLCEALKLNTTLTRLNLSGNAIYPEGSSVFADLLQTNTTLRAISLKRNFVREAIKDFAEALRHNNTLLKLSLRHCELAADGLVEVAAALKSNFTLTFLDLCENKEQWNSNHKSSLSKAFLDLLMTNRMLKLVKLDEDVVGSNLTPFRTCLNRNASLGKAQDDLLGVEEGFTIDELIELELREQEGGNRDQLSLQYIELDVWGRSVLELSHLTTLVICFNSLPSIPKDIALLANLVQLDCSHNLIASVHHSIRKLRRLEFLNMSYNKLTELPDTFGELQSLERVYLSNNQFSLFPEPVCALANLRVLDVGGNRIAQLPEPLVQLTRLEQLLVHSNRLQTLPDAIDKLTSLQRLYMFNNILDYLPTNMYKMKKHLVCLDFAYQNPLLTIPDWALTTSAIFPYLEELELKSNKFHTIKLMFLGDGNVGKTSTLRQFAGEKKKAKKENQATDGIDLRSWSHKMTQGSEKVPDVEFSSWDFAGQSLYYTTHQFFLSSRAIYLCMFNLVDPHTQTALDYWLHSVQGHVKKCPVVVVGTHVDDKKCTPQYVASVFDALKRRYNPRHFPCIKDFMAVSAKTGKGIPELRTRLADIAMADRLIGFSIPSKWIQLGKKLESLAAALMQQNKPPIVSWREFVRLAEEFNVSGEDTLEGAIKFLSEVGFVLFFGHEDAALRDTVFLDSSWLTDVMASLFTLKHNMIKEGRLWHVDLPFIWRPPKHPPSVHGVMLKLLERFAILFPLEPQKRTPESKLVEEVSLVPTLLPEERPAHVKDIWPAKVGIFGIDDAGGGGGAADGGRLTLIVGQWIRYYLFKFLPLGFFSRLLVRTLHIQSVKPLAFWRNGMVLQQGNYRALLEYNSSLYRLRIHVRELPNQGETPSDKPLSYMLWDNIDTLISGWFPEQLRDIQVVCAHCLASGAFDPFTFSLPDLELAVAGGNQFAYCRGIRPVRIDMMASEVALSDLDYLRVNFGDIEMGRELGAGSFATVYQGTYGGEVVAVKKMAFEDVDEEDRDDEELREKFAEFRKEVLLMSSLHHPNLVALKGICTAPFCLITEFLAGGDLYGFIHNKAGTEMSWTMRVKINIDICEGMKFLHSCTPPLLHRDLKSPNVLMVSQNPEDSPVAKVADFGLSVSLLHKVAGREVGNPVWLAPECMAKDRTPEYGCPSDVYSYGIVMWELYHQSSRPFEDRPELLKFTWQLEDAIVGRHLRPKIDPSCPDEYRELIEACWAGNPKVRPSFEQLLGRLDKLRSVLAPAIQMPRYTQSDLAAAKPSLLNSTTTRGNFNTKTGGATSAFNEKTRADEFNIATNAEFSTATNMIATNIATNIVTNPPTSTSGSKKSKSGKNHHHSSSSTSSSKNSSKKAPSAAAAAAAGANSTMGIATNINTRMVASNPRDTNLTSTNPYVDAAKEARYVATGLVGTQLMLNTGAVATNPGKGTNATSTNPGGGGDAGGGERRKAGGGGRHQCSGLGVLQASLVATLELPKNGDEPVGVQQIVMWAHPFLGLEPEMWVAGSDGSVTVFTTAAGGRKQTHRIAAHSKTIFCMRQVGDDIWTSSLDQTLKVWDIKTKSCQKTIKLKGSVTSIAAGVDDVFVGFLDGHVEMWKRGSYKAKNQYKPTADVRTASGVTCMRAVQAHHKASARKPVLWIAMGSQILVLDTRGWTRTLLIDAHQDVVHQMIWLGTEMWTCSSDKTIRVWNEDGEMIKELQGHTSRVFDVMAVGTEAVFSVGWEGSVMQWNAQTMQFVQEMRGSNKDAASALAAIEANGECEEFWSGSWDGKICCWRFTEPVEIPLHLDE